MSAHDFLCTFLWFIKGEMGEQYDDRTVLKFMFTYSTYYACVKI